MIHRPPGSIPGRFKYVLFLILTVCDLGYLFSGVEGCQLRTKSYYIYPNTKMFGVLQLLLQFSYKLI
jgi:hypothetical protein